MAACGPSVRVSGSDRALDLVRLDAACADVHPLGVSTHERTDALDVRVPAAVRTAVRVRDLLTEAGSSPTHITYSCHSGGGSVAGLHRSDETRSGAS